MRKQSFFLGVILGVSLSLPVLAADTGREKTERTVTVQGQGKVEAVPDIARLSIGVSQDGSSVETVSAQVREAIGKVLDAIKAQGIPEKDVQTQFYMVQPKWDWSNGRQRRVGFTVSNQVMVKVHDLKKIGRLLSAVTEAGATSVNGPDFDFDNPQELERRALVIAMEDAKAKAGVLAQASGAGLGDVVTISQSGPVNWPGPRRFAGALKMAAGSAVAEPIETGEQSFTSDITVTFALK